MCSTKDRKSTRLNSSHSSISYAVFCLKKKTQFGHPADLLDTRQTSDQGVEARHLVGLNVEYAEIRRPGRQPQPPIAARIALDLGDGGERDEPYAERAQHQGRRRPGTVQIGQPQPPGGPPGMREPPRQAHQPFFFNNEPTPELYTLSLHDALPI